VGAPGECDHGGVQIARFSTRIHLRPLCPRQAAATASAARKPLGGAQRQDARAGTPRRRARLRLTWGPLAYGRSARLRITSALVLASGGPPLSCGERPGESLPCTFAGLGGSSVTPCSCCPRPASWPVSRCSTPRTPQPTRSWERERCGDRGGGGRRRRAADGGRSRRGS